MLLKAPRGEERERERKLKEMNNESSHAYVPLSEDIFNNGDGEHNNNNNFESFLLRPQTNVTNELFHQLSKKKKKNTKTKNDEKSSRKTCNERRWQTSP